MDSLVVLARAALQESVEILDIVVLEYLMDLVVATAKVAPLQELTLEVAHIHLDQVLE